MDGMVDDGSQSGDADVLRRWGLCSCCKGDGDVVLEVTEVRSSVTVARILELLVVTLSGDKSIIDFASRD